MDVQVLRLCPNEAHAAGTAAGSVGDLEITDFDALDTALAALGDGPWDAVLVDLRHEFAHLAVDRLHRDAPDVPVVVVSPSTLEVEAEVTLSEGADDYVLEDEDIGAVLPHLIRSARTRRGGRLRTPRLPAGAVDRTIFEDRLATGLARSMRRDEVMGVGVVAIGEQRDGLTMRRPHPAVTAAVVERIASVAREVDTVAHTGGDELLLILENVGSRADTRHVIERFERAACKPVPGGGVSRVPHLWFGIALWPDHAASTDSLVRAAQTACDEAVETDHVGACFPPRRLENVRRQHRVAH